MELITVVVLTAWIGLIVQTAERKPSFGAGELKYSDFPTLPIPYFWMIDELNAWIAIYVSCQKRGTPTANATRHIRYYYRLIEKAKY